MEQNNKKDFISYEYKEITVKSESLSLYMDCYESFGWQADEHLEPRMGEKTATIQLKRNRKIMNKAELTRLQRNFEACAAEIDRMEQSKTTGPSITALTVGVVGTAFMAGSTFAVTHEPPLVGLSILLAVPGFLGWLAPYFLYKNRVAAQTRKLQPLIESKQEEIYALCEKGHALL